MDGVLSQKALSLQCFGSPERNDTKPFTASEGWSHIFRNRCELKNIRITGDVAANEEAAATLPTELNPGELMKEKGKHVQEKTYCIHIYRIQY